MLYLGPLSSSCAPSKAGSFGGGFVGSFAAGLSLWGGFETLSAVNHRGLTLAACEGITTPESIPICRSDSSRYLNGI